YCPRYQTQTRASPADSLDIPGWVELDFLVPLVADKEIGAEMMAQDNWEPTTPHRASMQKHSRQPHCSHSAVFHDEDDLVPAHSPPWEGLHRDSAVLSLKLAVSAAHIEMETED